MRGTEDAVFVSRGKTVSVLLNPRQYERGALLVIPNRHTSSLIDTHEEPFLAVQIEARRMARLLVEQLGATGVNVFQNAGTAAGQTVPHYHVHVVPRYPDSDPGLRFREADYGVTPNEQLYPIAEILNAPRAAVLARFRTALDDVSDRRPRLWWFLYFAWLTVAIAAFARHLTASDTALGVPSSILLIMQVAAVAVYSRALSAKSQRNLIAGYVGSISLLAVSLLLTL